MTLYEVYTSHHETLLRFAKSLTRDTYQAEDLIQSAYLKSLDNDRLFEHMHPEQIKAWYFTTIKNLYIDQLRRDTQYPKTLLDAYQPDTVLTKILVKEALESLAPQDRALIVLRYMYGYTSKEIATITGKNASTVRSRLSYLVQHLKPEL